jgi:hypothetical protein
VARGYFYIGLYIKINTRLHRNTVTCWSVTLDGVSDWILDLLTTYTHDSQLQATTAPQLISTINKSPQHPLSLFQPAVVFTSRSPVTASNSGDSSSSALKSSLNGGYLAIVPFHHSLPYRTDSVAPIVSLITPRHGPRRPHRSFSYANRVYRAIPQQQLSILAY